MRHAGFLLNRFLVPGRTWKVVMWSSVATTLFIVFALPFTAHAGLQQNVAEFLGVILSAIIWFVGKLLLLVIFILIQIAQYKDFVTSPAVSTGWVIVRDVANMFFIVILLVIAFATILNVSSYQYKQMLPQLIIAALLINFSKTIAGIFIDISQVVMLTFVNGFAAAAGGNFASMFQIDKLLKIDPGIDISETKGFGAYQLVGGYLLALVMILIALATTLVLTVILAFRIVMLWALVVLSPLPYLLRILPKRGAQYASKWWDEFFNYLIVGPVLAFFLWLSLVTIGSGNLQGFEGAGKIGGDEAKAFNLIGTQAGSTEALIAYVIGISMLVAGLKIAGELGVAGSGFANQVRGSIAKAGKFMAYKYTGARFLRERAGGYLAARGEIRKAKVSKDVAAVQRGFGAAEEWVGAKMRMTVGGAGTLAGHLAYGRKAQKEEAKAKELRAKAQVARDKKNFPKAEDLDREASTAQTKAAEFRRTQARVEREVNLGVVAIAGAATGGIGLALAPLAFGKNVEASGKKIRQKGQDYTFSKAMDGRKEIKDLEPGEILTQAHAGNLSAILEAIEQQLIPPGELDAMEALLKENGADKKTQQVFARTAEKQYFGTRNSSTKALARTDLEPAERTRIATERAADRQRAIEGGLVNMRSLIPAELAVDDGELARDFVIHGSSDQRKELGKNKAHKDAYKQGVTNALAVEKDPGNRQKLAVEVMRLGKGPKDATGYESTALENSKMDATAFGSALKTPEAYQLVVNLDAARDLQKPGITNAIAQNLSAAQFRSARGAAVRDEDTTKAQTIAAIESALKQSANYKLQDQENAKVRGAQDKVADVKKALNTAKAADRPQLENDLRYARTQLKMIEFQVKQALDKKMSAQEQELYESLKSKRK